MKKILGSCGESEAEGRLALRLDRGLDALDHFSGIVDQCVKISAAQAMTLMGILG